MTDNMIELGKRAVACKGFRWLPGMLDPFGRRAMWVYPEDGIITWSHIPENCVDRDADALPDLTDPATVGCLLALYEETRKMLTCPDPVYTMVAAWGLMHPRTLDALVAALEAAP